MNKLLSDISIKIHIQLFTKLIFISVHIGVFTSLLSNGFIIINYKSTQLSVNNLIYHFVHFLSYRPEEKYSQGLRFKTKKMRARREIK